MPNILQAVIIPTCWADDKRTFPYKSIGLFGSMSGMKYISTQHLALGVLFIATSLSLGQDRDTNGRRTITVGGKSEHSLPADRAVISAEVRVENETLANSREQSEASLKRLITRLSELGIKPEKIELTNHSLRKNYKKIGDHRKHIGFYSEREFLINLDDVSLLEAVHQELAEDPEIETRRTNFFRKDEIEIRKKARREALEAAKEKATTMSSVLAQKIGKVIKIEEDTNRYGFSENNSFSNSAFMITGNTTSGRVSISAAVKVVFELVD